MTYEELCNAVLPVWFLLLNSAISFSLLVICKNFFNMFLIFLCCGLFAALA